MKRSPTVQRLWRWLLALALAVPLVGLSIITSTPEPVGATHGRAAQLTWHKTTGTTVEFHYTFSARRSFYGTSPAKNVGDTIIDPVVTFGDGTTNSPTLTVIAVDAANDVLIAEAHITHAYAGVGPYTAYSSSCCRLSGSGGQINNKDGVYRVETIVNLAATSASPLSQAPPLVDCPKNALCQFSVPATDPDGQALNFRLATSMEATGSATGFTQPGPPDAPNAASISANGIYSWNTTGATLAPAGTPTFYSTTVIIENIVSGNVVAKIATDFLIRLTDQGSTNQPPVFTGSTPADGAIINASVGSPVTFSASATDPDLGHTVTLSLLGKPASSTFTSSPGNPATGSFSWTPNAMGDNLMTLQAQDQNGLGAQPRGITIRVGPGGGGGGGGTPPGCLTPGSLDFGTQTIGSNPPSQLALLNNCGSVPLAISTVTKGGTNAADYDIVTSCANTTVPAGASCGIRVVFHPAAAGTQSATVSVNFTGGTSVLNLTGIGAPPVPPFDLTILTNGSCTVGISPNPGPYTSISTITLTPQPAAGWIFVYWRSERGFMGWADPWTFQIDADHTVTAYCVPLETFTDYPLTGAAKADPIIRMTALNIIRGYGDGRFGPNDTTQRAQMAALICRGMGFDRLVTWDQEDYGNPFIDRGGLDANLWRNVGTLYYYNVGRGYDGIVFGPTDGVTKAQTISFFTRAMVVNGYWQQQPDNPSIYPNVPGSSGHRTDIATYVFYVGTVPGTNSTGQSWGDWNATATRAWFSQAEWKGINDFFTAGFTP